MANHEMSERRACKAIGCSRMTIRYTSTRSDDGVLREQMRELARERRRNAFIESFNGRLRDELLNETLFTSLVQASVVLASWRTDYNDSRPHSQLGWKTPSEFAYTFHPRRDLAPRYAKGSAPAPAANPTHEAFPTARCELITG